VAHAAAWKGDIEFAEPAERERLLLSRLRSQAATLVEVSASIRGRFADAGIKPDDLTSLEALRAIAPITKAEIIADQAAKPPYGTLLGCDPDELVRLYVGPGPQVTFFTPEDLAATVAHGSWAFFTNGFRKSDVVDVTIMYHWVIAGTLMDDAYRAIGCAVLPGGIGMGAEHLASLKLLNATGLFAFPTFLEELANKAEQSGVLPARDLPHLRLVTIAGEMRSTDLQQRMEDFWGMKVREIYGGAEMPFMAAQCSEGGGMHLNPDFLIEVLDAETKQPVGPGEPGVIVASESERIAYPMIRYWTGDITAGLDVVPCACGRTTPRMGRILGRVGDIARVKGLFVVPAQVQRALDSLPELGKFQLVVDRPGTQDTLCVRIEHGGPVADRPRLAEEAADRIKEGIRLSTVIELVDMGALGESAQVVVDKRDVS
jgi:phenylacetate-CoA ligase